MLNIHRVVAGCALGLCSLVSHAGELLIEQTPGVAVVSAHPLATRAGLEVLHRGGNAFDAAVAVTAALAVVEPQGSGLGGGGFYLMHRTSDRFSLFVDARETAPDAATGDLYLDRDELPVRALSYDGPLASAIPGTPAAMEHIARSYGRLPLSQSLAPAIRYARDGFAIDPALAGWLSASSERLSPAARTVFLPEGVLPEVGDRLVQADLARTLQAIADRGARGGFYSGEVAKRLRDGVFADGGIWSLRDLERYRIREREPMVVDYRGHRITTAPLPSAGGIAMAQVLGVLEQRAWPPNNEHAARHELVEALRLAFHDRAKYLGDPDFVEVPVARLTGRDYVQRMSERIGAQALPSTTLVAETGRPFDMLAQAPDERQTTHFSIIDRDGNRVSATLTLNSAFGSGYMPPGTGVLLNNEMDAFATAPLVRDLDGALRLEPNHIQPHKRPLSSMTPAFVDGPRGVFVTGTPGGSRIVSAVLLSVLAHINGMDVQQVVAMPRFHHQFLPDLIEFEARALTPEQREALALRGHSLHELSEPFGNMQAIHWNKMANSLYAASDPRGYGAAEVRLIGLSVADR